MIVLGPVPCRDCRETVVYGRRMDRGNPARTADTFPDIRDAATGTPHRCVEIDQRPFTDRMTRRAP